MEGEITQVCRSVCGVTFLDRSEPIVAAALLAWRVTRWAAASLLIGRSRPRAGKRAASGGSGLARVQAVRVAVVGLSSGVILCLRPLPVTTM